MDLKAPKTAALLHAELIDQDIIDQLLKMEEFLRYFRRCANNYVPAEKLAEVDEFLKP